MLQSCETKPKNDYFFVLKDWSKEIENSKDSSVCIMPFYYGTHNFIFYNDTTIYYHFYESYYMCGTGIDFMKPPHLRITPDSLKRVPIEHLFYFMKETALIKRKYRDITSVALSVRNDTIRNLLIPYMQNTLNKVPKFIVGVRRCTEEEEVVAIAKFTSSPFDPITHKWKN